MSLLGSVSGAIGSAAGALNGALGISDDIAMAGAFIVMIDYLPLGAWNSCEGLGVQVDTEEYTEGGNNTMVWKLPTRLKYPNIKLTRPVTQQTAMMASFFKRMGRKPAKYTGVIEAHTMDGSAVCVWGLAGVQPVSWTGPRLGHDQNSVATETIEFSHEGFLDAAGILKGVAGNLGLM